MNELRESRRKYLEKTLWLENICNTGGIDLPGLASLKGMLEKQTFEVAFVGEFTAGKSTLINALLGADILPTALAATTARITYIKYGPMPAIRLRLNSGKWDDRQSVLDELKELVAGNAGSIRDVESIHLDFPSDLLMGGVCFIDTPGTNDTEAQRVALTHRILPDVDAVVYVTIYPVTESNLKAFDDLVIQNGISSVFFVLNKLDELEGQEDDVTEAAKACFESRTGSPIRLFLLSALDYLEGQRNDNQFLREKSRFEVFLEELKKFLMGTEKYKAQERQYDYHLDKLKRQAEELIKVKIASFNMPDEEFRKKRNKLEADLKKHSEEANRLSEDVSAEIDRLVSRLERSLDKLLVESLQDIDLKFDLQTGDQQALVRLAEIAVRQHYDAWRRRNEAVVQKFMETLAKEVHFRLGGMVQGMRFSLAEYTSGSMVRTGTAAPTGFRTDDRTATAVISVASAGTYATLAIAHIAIAPVALLIAPVSLYWLHQHRQQERKAVKERMMTDIQMNAEAFRKETLRGIQTARQSLTSDIQDTARDFAKNIHNQLEAVDRERKVTESNIQLKIKELDSLLVSLKETKAN